MPANSPDLPPPKGVTRRGFVKGLTAAAIVAGSASTVAQLSREEAQASPPATADQSPTESISIEKEFENFSEQEKAILEKEVSQEKDQYQTYVDAKGIKHQKDIQPRINNTLRWEGVIKQIVDDPRLQIPDKDQRFWINRALQIVFVESEGKISPPTPYFKGLMQLGPHLIEAIAKKFKIPHYYPERFWDNIFFGIAHQLEMSERFGTELAAWTHHLGSGNMDVALGSYLKTDLRGASNKTILDLIKQHKINPVSLLQNIATVNILTANNAFNDQTDRYYYRLLAAEQILDQRRTTQETRA